MKKTIIIIVVLLVVAAVGMWYVTRPENTGDPASPTTSSAPGSETADNGGAAPQTDEQQTFTAAEIAQHSNASDCWTIIDGSVYDLTSFITQHPGGDEILRACGTDATTLFNSRTTESGETVGSGTPHSASAQSQLESLKIGTLE